MKQTVLLLLLACTVVFNLSAGEHWFAEKFSKTLVNSNGRVTDTARALNGKLVIGWYCVQGGKTARWVPFTLTSGE